MPCAWWEELPEAAALTLLPGPISQPFSAPFRSCGGKYCRGGLLHS